MAQAQLAAVQQYIRRLVVDGTMKDWSDGQLLEALATPQREAAFAVLLRRHGPMVWALCRACSGTGMMPKMPSKPRS